MLKTVNILLLVSVLMQVITIFYMLILKSYALMTLHEINGILFILLIGMHLLLNFSWIKRNIFTSNKQRTHL
jgi:hypothetical protein